MTTGWRAAAAALLTLFLVDAVPRHVPTADYWYGYAGTKVVSAEQEARWTTLVETNLDGARLIRPYGVLTMNYRNPNRVQPSDPIWSSQEDFFAHTCSGERARGEVAYSGQLLTNLRSPALIKAWRESTGSPDQVRYFSFVFDDEATGTAYAQDQPCNYTFDDWLSDEINLIRNAPMPVIYNGLEDFYNHGVAREIALNRAAAGGMMEECYAQLSSGDARLGGWRWYATEATELQMAAQKKYFLCYGRDQTPAEQAGASRMYTYASYLLTYDPHTTVLWEYYKTATGDHIMPETQLVALNPRREIRHVAELHQSSGIYMREYAQCYLAGRPVGACAAIVNPDSTPHDVHLPGYSRMLQLQGSGTYDGGSVRIVRQGPPASLDPLGAAILFK